MALSEWATNSSDLPDLFSYLVVKTDLEQWIRAGRTGSPSAGPRFRLLKATASLLNRTEDTYPNADILISISSVLIRRSDIRALQQWAGTGPLDGFTLDVNTTDSIFLGEWPDGRSYIAGCTPEFRPATWQDATDRLGLGVPATVVTERYCWEGVTYDCSLPATLNVHLLTAGAARLFPGIKQRDGIARTPDGALIHLDPAPTPGEPGTLIVDEQRLGQALVREGLVLVQILQQTKRVLFGIAEHRFAGETNVTRLIGSVGEEVLCDITRQRTLEPRLR